MMNTSIFGIVAALVIGAIGGYLISGSTTATPKETMPATAEMSEVADTSFTPPTTNAEKIANAISAAPEQIGKDATVLDWPGADGKLSELKKGTNAWTCLPDYPATPG